MKSPSLSRILSIVLLALVFAVPLAQAEEPASRPAHGAFGFSSMMELLDRAWEGIVSLWAENGAILDPDGLGAAGPGESGAEAACDNGAIADPNGGCRSGS